MTSRFDRDTRPGCVEVDDVQPLGAGQHVSLCHLDGIPVVRLAVEVALNETHATTVPDVDRRPQVHSASPPTRTGSALAAD